ncbi:MAG: hypothetical protein AAB389_02075 [Patescibacteria group bacterium]
MDAVFNFFFGGWKNILGCIIVIFGLCYLQWPEEAMKYLLVGVAQVKDVVLVPLWPVLKPLLLIAAAIAAFVVMTKGFTGGGGGGGGKPSGGGKPGGGGSKKK